MRAKKPDHGAELALIRTHNGLGQKVDRAYMADGAILARTDGGRWSLTGFTVRPVSGLTLLARRERVAFMVARAVAIACRKLEPVTESEMLDAAAGWSLVAVDAYVLGVLARDKIDVDLA